MAAAEKISISLDGEALLWMKKRARRQKTTLSAVFFEAAKLLQQQEARLAVIEMLGDKARLTDRDRARIDAEWKD
jgi:hypothetical protein